MIVHLLCSQSHRRQNLETRSRSRQKGEGSATLCSSLGIVFWENFTGDVRVVFSVITSRWSLIFCDLGIVFSVITTKWSFCDLGIVFSVMTSRWSLIFCDLRIVFSVITSRWSLIICDLGIVFSSTVYLTRGTCTFYNKYTAQTSKIPTIP